MPNLFKICEVNMKFKKNRFAFLPIRCTDCQQYVWLEPYRKDTKWMKFAGRFLDVNICKDCLQMYKLEKTLEKRNK